MKYLKLAVGFLTTLPVQVNETLQPGDLGRAAAWYPLVGLVLGGVLYGAFWLGSLWFIPGLLGALIVGLWAALTGGLHLDGLADCGDGLLAATSRERRLEIMKDPRLGTFGGAALFLHLFIKANLVAALPADRALLALLIAPTLARWLILWVARQPMARPGGLGVEFALGVTRRTYGFAVLAPLALVILSLFTPTEWRGLLAVVLAHLVVLGAIRLARARLGGVTGDVMGLTIELGESAALLAFVIR